MVQKFAQYLALFQHKTCPLFQFIYGKVVPSLYISDVVLNTKMHKKFGSHNGSLTQHMQHSEDTITN